MTGRPTADSREPFVFGLIAGMCAAALMAMVWRRVDSRLANLERARWDQIRVVGPSEEVRSAERDAAVRFAQNLRAEGLVVAEADRGSAE